MNHEILICGFGGQGILFAGKLLAYGGMEAGANISWLPSYGPEMRGGTANCSVIISDASVGSPIVNKPNLLIAMNLPSYDKFEPAVQPGGKAFVDSSLITRKAARADVETFYIPATQMAADRGLTGLANMIMVGKFIRETAAVDYARIRDCMAKVVPERKKDLFEKNLEAVALGYDY